MTLTCDSSATIQPSSDKTMRPGLNKSMRLQDEVPVKISKTACVLPEDGSVPELRPLHLHRLRFERRQTRGGTLTELPKLLLAHANARDQSRRLLLPWNDRLENLNESASAQQAAGLSQDRKTKVEHLQMAPQTTRPLSRPLQALLASPAPCPEPAMHHHHSCQLFSKKLRRAGRPIAVLPLLPVHRLQAHLLRCHPVQTLRHPPRTTRLLEPYR